MVARKFSPTIDSEAAMVENALMILKEAAERTENQSNHSTVTHGILDGAPRVEWWQWPRTRAQGIRGPG